MKYQDYANDMKCIIAVVSLLFGIDAAGTGSLSDPFQQYVKKGQEAVLQCRYERQRLKWSFTNSTIIASENTVIDPKKYKVSVTSTGLYYRLHVLNTQPDDEEIYSCRGGINEEHHIKLNLYVPPTRLYFHGSTNSKLEGTEEKDLLIRCLAEGGKPPPDVSILDGTRPNKTQEVNYTIPMISRDYHQKSIVCNATSDALVNPMTNTVQIYLNLKPLKPIFKKNEVSTEETLPLVISCTSYGSRPAATFTWKIGVNDVTSSPKTSTSVTESNDTITVTSTLTSSVNKTHNNQSIICIAYNTVGSVSASKILDVKFAPDITVDSPTYAQNNDKRTVTCSPSGNPDSYTYHKWQHKSRYGEIIREFDGNKTLKLPDVSEEKTYQDNGEYVCTVDNGIKDKDYKLEQKGSGYVTVNAQPVFTSDTIDRVKQFGEINKAVDIYVNVYSVPKFTSFEWTLDGKPINQNSGKYKSSSSPSIVNDNFHGKPVQVDGYNVTLTISDLEVDDFTNYTVTLTNGFGIPAIYTIILVSASRPGIPGNFSNIASSSTSITVQWDPNSGGGYKQTFYLEYRVQGSLHWMTKTAGEQDINESKSPRTYELRYLLAGKTYELRMFAENTAEKRSNFTEVMVAFTESSGSEPSVAAIIGGVAGGLTAIIIVLLVICFIQKKRKDDGTPSTKLRANSEEEEEDGLKDNILYESSQSDILKKNVLYQSAGSDFENRKKPSTSSKNTVVQKPNAIYAEVSKVTQPKNVKEKKQEDKKGKPKKARKEKTKDKKGKPKKARKEKTKAMNNNPEEEYANSALQMKNFNDGEYANPTDSQGASGHHINEQGLEYADLTFRQIPAKNQKQVIHGNDERTIYADVDHTKKAPTPPPESEYEETNIKHGKMA